jgi:hypothetical protein
MSTGSHESSYRWSSHVIRDSVKKRFVHRVLNKIAWLSLRPDSSAVRLIVIITYRTIIVIPGQQAGSRYQLPRRVTLILPNYQRTVLEPPGNRTQKCRLSSPAAPDSKITVQTNIERYLSKYQYNGAAASASHANKEGVWKGMVYRLKLWLAVAV